MTSSKTSEKVVVVGAGLMGTGIAHAFCSSGYPTVLVDISQPQLDKAVQNIKQILADGVRLGKSTEEKAKQANALLSSSTEMVKSATGATLLVETASEKIDIKLKIMQDIEPVIAKDGIIGTNTSALSITEIAAATKDPSRVFGMHFFNPVHKMKLLELVRGLATTPEVILRGKVYGDALGKTTIIVNEAPGFTTSRMSCLLGNEAMYMLQEGTATAEDIDTALRLGFNHPMGPLELGDLTGWDTRLAVLMHLYQTLGEKFRPCPLIHKMVKAGRYGRKVGHGVYLYKDGQKVAGSGLKVGTL